MGLAENRQALVANGPHRTVRLQTDGPLRTGRDLAMAILLGVEEFGFGNTLMVVLGGLMCRRCRRGVGGVFAGIAAQVSELRTRFKSRTEHVKCFLHLVAEDLREHMARLGFRSVEEMTGRVDRLEPAREELPVKASTLDLSAPLADPTRLRKNAASRSCPAPDAVPDIVSERELPAQTLPVLDGSLPMITCMGTVRRRRSLSRSGFVLKQFPEESIMKFTKMHGIGNDYIYVNLFEESVSDPQALARRISDRHFGVGSDGLVLIMPSDVADVRMRMFNSDGTEAEMCGNAIRCVGKYAYDVGLARAATITVETASGIKTLRLHLENGAVRRAGVDMGEPELRPERIPVRAEGELFLRRPVEVDGRIWPVTAVSMGNPHAVVFLEKGTRVEDVPLERLGPLFEHHPLFPRRINTEFVEVSDRGRLKMRVWERGAGETLACGTGACAVGVAAVLNGLTEPRVSVHLPGGVLDIEWNRTDNHVYLTGDAATVFTGEYATEQE